ncbi:LPXTG cell wall anchor domain-containing protein [Streptomyces sp. NPDC000983]|uniref:LPXTG cell wall anchor domain-containing protein n=1 Tax=Streptomyces sp. NPDC000983 TaxID=3154373 RepID=UPI00331841AC
MSSARRPLLTATAAGALLCALWFVPSAKASADEPYRPASASGPTTQMTQTTPLTGATEVTEATKMAQMTQQVPAGTTSVSHVELADTGSFDTTPYVLGGTASLALGAGFVVYSIRRERHGF